MKHGAAQTLHAVIGNARQTVLRDKMRRPSDRKNAHHRHRHRPQRQGAFAEAFVEQRLEQSRYQGFGDSRHDGGQNTGCPAPALLSKIGQQAFHALKQALFGAGFFAGVDIGHCP